MPDPQSASTDHSIPSRSPSHDLHDLIRQTDPLVENQRCGPDNKVSLHFGGLASHSVELEPGTADPPNRLGF